MIVDLFAGPGGWSEGLRMLGLSDVGIELDAAACATRAAAGHRTIRADVETYPRERFAGIEGLIASPPCQDFSLAGKQVGRTGEKGRLIDLVPEWVEATWPEWIACEQVPPCLPIWQEHARWYRTHGYSVWCGILNAADFGVPQTRRRAFLIASAVGVAEPPAPTHAKHPGESLFGSTRQWVTMAGALGWGMTASGQRLLDGGSGARERVRREYEAGRWEGKAPRWVYTRPATTVVGSFRPDVIAAPGYRTDISRQDAPDSVTVEPWEGGVLQTFPADYPWQGSRSAQFLQVGNAVPPLLAAHVIASLTGRELEQAA